MEKTEPAWRSVLGWVMYDFANSAYAVVILAVIFNNYFATVVAGGEAGLLYRVWDWEFRIPGVSVFSFINVAALLVVATASPVLGALADYSGRKKRYLAAAWLLGVGGTSLLSLVGPGDLAAASLLFVLSNIGFAAGSIFYDAFLPEVCRPGSEARISGAGYAAGYLGGGLLLVLVLVMKQLVEGFEYTHSFLMTGLWWLVFALPTILWLHDRPVPVPAGRLGGYIKIGYRKVRRTLDHFGELSTLRRFLLAYLVYGTGIESVIRLASIFGAIELGMEQGELIVFFLVIQGTALVGAMVFGWLADAAGNRPVLLVTLWIWVGALIWAWLLGLFFDPLKEFWIVGELAGLAMGGSQGISRALQSVILPAGMENEFFGFFSMAGRSANILGMLSFGMVTWITGDMRLGILSLLVFFLGGIVILRRVSEVLGREEAERFSISAEAARTDAGGSE